jgi:hypothetical protein
MDTQALQRQIDELRREVESLRNGASIPHDVEQAFRQRLKIGTIPTLSVSAKSATSENTPVDEAGSGSYSVLGIPNGFLEVSVGGAVKYIPIYT